MKYRNTPEMERDSALWLKLNGLAVDPAVALPTTLVLPVVDTGRVEDETKHNWATDGAKGTEYKRLCPQG